MNEYKAIIFDIDGTAMPSGFDTEPSDRVIEAIDLYRDKLVLTAATGRSFGMMRHIIPALGLEHPCVINGGSQIIHPRSGEIVWKKLLTLSQKSRISQIANKFDYEIYFNHHSVDPDDEEVLKEEAGLIAVLGVSPQDSNQIKSELKKIPATAIHILPSWTEHHFDIHITRNNATKKHGITELIRRLGLTKDQVVGVGDGNNDFPLFEAVGLKVAMGNAEEGLKAKADLVCDTVKNDGLAKLIENFATN